jgi:tetratricopeptide (TPR) repeat protein
MAMAALLCGSPFNARATANGPPSVADFLFEWAAGKALDNYYDRWTGKPDIREMQRDLDLLVERYHDQASVLRELRDQLDTKLTRKQMEEIVNQTLSKLEPELGALAQRIRQREYELQYHRYLLDQHRIIQDHLRAEIQGLSGEVAVLGGRLDEQGRQLRATARDMEAFRRQFPRWEPELHVAQLGIAGMALLRQKKPKEAERLFLFGQSVTPDDAGLWYGLALAYRDQGKIQLARQSLQKVSPLAWKQTPPWYQFILEQRMPRSDRAWLSSGGGKALPSSSR